MSIVLLALKHKNVTLVFIRQPFVSMSQKNITQYTLQKNRKCIDCKERSPKYIIDSKFKFLNVLINSYKVFLDCYIKRLLSVQSDFQSQKYDC